MSAAFSAPRSSYRRLVAAGVLLPAAFVALDRLLLDALAGACRNNWTMLLTMAAFIVQIGAMGVICGRWIDWPPLRWIFYGWTWLLIDFQTLIAWALANQSWWGDAFQAAALVAAQLGLVTLALGSPLVLLLIRIRFWGEDATLLFAVQTIALAAICAWLRRQDYRLIIARQKDPGSVASGQHNSLSTTQFELRDVLIWTTALAIVFGIVRAIGLPIEQWLETRYRSWLPLVANGGALAIVLVVALWAALGAGSTRTRWAIVLVATPAIGYACGTIDCLVRIWEDRLWTAPWARAMTWWNWLEWILWWPLYDPVVRPTTFWMCLAGGMLFAALLFWRSLGYRLEKITQRGSGVGW